MTVTGYKEIDAVLAGLDKQINHRVMQAANAEAAKVLVQKEHLLSPVGETGGLAESHGIVKPSVSRAGSIGEILVGPRRGKYKGHAAHLVEFGTKNRKNKSGANRGQVTATHYLERAYNSTIGTVQSKIAQFVGAKLYSFMRRTIKNAG